MADRTKHAARRAYWREWVIERAQRVGMENGPKVNVALPPPPLRPQDFDPEADPSLPVMRIATVTFHDIRGRVVPFRVELPDELPPTPHEIEVRLR